MVGGLGLGGSLISYGAAMVPGGANLVSKVLANDDGRYRLEAVLESAKRDVSDLWESNRHLVEALSDVLLERHELIGSEITQVLVEAEAEFVDPTIDLTVRS
jgi:cell division protease FtsH